MPEVLIIAALEREVRALVSGWERIAVDVGQWSVPGWRKGEAMVVAGGIGMTPARRAAQAGIALCKPRVVVSTGFAGGLEAAMTVGSVLRPQRVVDAASGRGYPIESGWGTLVTAGNVADAAFKRGLRERYQAQAVDMEAAAVAEVAAGHGIKFIAVKAISDAGDFPMPDFGRFVDERGRLDPARLMFWAALRPWMWSSLQRLGAQTDRASRELCAALSHLIELEGSEDEQPVQPARQR